MLGPHGYYSDDRLRSAAAARGLPPARLPAGETRRRDRHGRGPRGPRLHPALPGWLTRRESFYQEVSAAVAEMVAREPSVGEIEFGVQEVPPSDPADWEEHDVVLARVFPRDRRRGLKDRIVLYRRPLAARASAGELPFAIRILLAERICEVLALSPDDLLS